MIKTLGKTGLVAIALLAGPAWAQCTASVTWMPPGQFTDGSALDPATDLSEYRIYEGTAVVASPAPATQSFELQDVGFGTHDYTMTAVALNGNESDMSNTDTFECVDNRTPAAPTILDIIMAFLRRVLFEWWA